MISFVSPTTSSAGLVVSTDAGLKSSVKYIKYSEGSLYHMIKCMNSMSHFQRNNKPLLSLKLKGQYVLYICLELCKLVFMKTRLGCSSILFRTRELQSR